MIGTNSAAETLYVNSLASTLNLNSFDFSVFSLSGIDSEVSFFVVVTDDFFVSGGISFVSGALGLMVLDWALFVLADVVVGGVDVGWVVVGLEGDRFESPFKSEDDFFNSAGFIIGTKSGGIGEFN